MYEVYCLLTKKAYHPLVNFGSMCNDMMHHNVFYDEHLELIKVPNFFNFPADKDGLLKVGNGLWKGAKRRTVNDLGVGLGQKQGKKLPPYPQGQKLMTSRHLALNFHAVPLGQSCNIGGNPS